MFTTRPELQGSVGMVSSTHWLASSAGMARLEAGGNAVDAAVTAGLTLQVVEPHLNGPGGDLPVILAGPGVAPTVLCGQGVAPAAAAPDAFAGVDLIPGSGLLAATVPGAFPAWLTLLRGHGTATLREVTEPARHYAAAGVPMLPQIAATIARVAELFRTEWPTSAATFLGHGDRLRNPVWAATLQRIVDEAEAATPDRDAQLDHALRSWSQGFVADAIGAFARTSLWDSSGERHAGVLTADDLAAWRPGYEAPATLEFGGISVCKTAAWGQGPVLLQQLALLDGLELRPGTADVVHTVVEAAKLAFADREAWYGDAPGADVPLDTLLSPAYAAQRRTLIGSVAADGLRPGSPDGRAPRLPELLRDAERRGGRDLDPTTSEPTVDRTGRSRGDTCHVSVADRFGTLVSATPSGGWLQSSPVVPELGFPLGTRLQMAWLQQGLPNSLSPGRRPRTTLSPTLALRAGRPALAFGTPGGDQQDQWQLGFLLNHLAGMNLQQAIDAPAFHTTAFPSSFHPRESYPRQVVVEGRFDPAVVAELRARGHDVVVGGAWSLGRMCAVGRDEDGWLRAAANPRGMQGYAVGR